MRSRSSLYVLLLVIIGTIFFSLFNLFSEKYFNRLKFWSAKIIIIQGNHSKKDIPLSFVQKAIESVKKEVSLPEYILDTPLCKIPRTQIMPEYFNGKWHKEKILDCSYEEILWKIKEDETYELLPAYQDETCAVSEISRVEGNDNTYFMQNWTEVKYDFNVKNMEQFVVKCKKFMNFDNTFPLTSNVSEKLNFWKDQANQESHTRPMNVILIGIDSVSRSHAHRSLPKTMALLERMGFIDFPGYHSVAPSTLSNFMAFLMGMERPNIRKFCAPDWETPFDSCPLIWKQFSQHRYVTSYIEDGSQTFNWGGQSGFHHRPTDYHLHSLFIAMEKLRKESKVFDDSNPKEYDKKAYCMSTETVPEFVTRYTKRFIRKFQNVPFFSFTWYANPFHDYVFSLHTIDDNLYNFYDYINSKTELLQNSLIVFLSDHGDRTSFFLQEKMEGYIERGLPPLYIRIPETLLAKYPELDLKKVMIENSRQLISPFDLHHTLLHLLNLTNLEIDNNFNPVMSDRNSLFVPIGDKNRTCGLLHLGSDSCVCNTLLNAEAIESPFYLRKIAQLLEKKLNNLVGSESQYKKVCATWEVQKSDIISTQVLTKTNAMSEILIRFKATPVESVFESKIEVIHKKTGFDSAKLIGEINRINKYGDQSDCIPFKTDKDKKMKSYCYCKNKVKKVKHT